MGFRIIWGGSRNPQLNDYLKQWAERRIWPHGREFGPCVCMGVMADRETLIAVVIFHNYEPDAGIIEISGAGDAKNWMSKRVLRAMFKYAFEDAGCQMIVQRNPEHSVMNRIQGRFGYTLHRIERLRGRDEAEIVCTFTDDQWRNHPMNKTKSVAISRRETDSADMM